MKQRGYKTNNAELVMLTVKEVVELLKIGRTTLYRYMENGKIKYYKFGKSVRFKKSDIEKFIEEHEA